MAKPKLTQRDFMRGLYRQYRGDREKIYKAVERATKTGDFRRRSNTAKQTLRYYVSFLIEAGKRTGWITKKIKRAVR